jgi:tetratricopeptide (TPR) repeat protein
MTMREGLPAGLPDGPAGRPRRDRAYFLDLLGDSHNGLGAYGAAIEAYQQAAEEFRTSGAHCSYALCLLKIAECYLGLEEPWHAVGYLEACLPLLRDLRLVRHHSLAQQRLDGCQAGLAQARLLAADSRARTQAGTRPAS